MDKEMTPEQLFAAESADTLVPRLLMKGISHDLIVAKLVRLDWSPKSARVKVLQVANDLRRYHESPESRAKLVQEAWWHVATGAGMAVLGVIMGAGLLLLSALMPLPFVVLAFGPVIGGLTLVARNLGRWRLYRQYPLPFAEPGSDGWKRADPGIVADRPT